MPELRVRITATGPLLAKGPAVVQRRLEGFAWEAVKLLEREVKLRLPAEGEHARGVNKGHLRASILGEVLQKGTPAVKGVVGTPVAYAAVIEKGRTAGKGRPPRGPLEAWIREKLGLADDDEVRRAAFAIGGKIATKGFPGVHMFERALAENLGTLGALAAKAGLRLAAELDG